MSSFFTLNNNWILQRDVGEDEVVLSLLSDLQDNANDPFQTDSIFFIGNADGSVINQYSIVEQRAVSQAELNEYFGSSDKLIRKSDWHSHYVDSVEKALSRFKSGALEKVVLSEKSEYTSRQHPLHTFSNLLELYTDSTCYIFHVEESGLWLGASPEKLFIKNSDQIELMALAGTRPIGGEDWTQKEKLEQGIVTENMMTLLYDYKFTDIKIEGPFDKSNGPIEHLCTNISGSQKEIGVWLEFLKHIHPSPALSGFPKERALGFIQQAEEHVRELFTGFYGFNIGNRADINIIIRCSKFVNGVYELFAGAGINSGSIAQNEVKELERKFEIMLAAIDQN